MGREDSTGEQHSSVDVELGNFNEREERKEGEKSMFLLCRSVRSLSSPPQAAAAAVTAALAKASGQRGESRGRALYRSCSPSRERGRAGPASGEKREEATQEAKHCS